MKVLFDYFFVLCLLRVKPQDLRASNVLFALTLLANLILAVGVLSDLYGGASRALFAGLVDNLFLLAVLWLLLFWKGMLPRLTQTATALLGTSLLLGLISVPLRMMGGPGEGEPTSMAVLAGLGSLFVLVWFFAYCYPIARWTIWLERKFVLKF